MFAILNIWPSMVFENATNGIYSSTIDESIGVYQGWIAQYQLWSIGPDDPVIKEQWDFPLDEQEISSHVAIFQSGSSTCWNPLSLPSTEAEVSLHFPTSIGQNLDMFTVLHTVYIHNGEHPYSRETSETNPGGWSQTRLPFAYDTRTLSFLQPVDHSIKNPCNGGVGPNEGHTVFQTLRTTTSRIFTHNDLIIYQGVASRDNENGNYFGHHSVNESCLRVISKMGTNGKDFKIDLIAILDCLDFENVFSSCTFHPNLPLLALIWHTETFSHCAALWSFASQDPIRSFGINYVTPIDFHKDTATTSKVLADCGPAVRVQFSGCGNSLLVEFLYQYYPAHFPLQDSPAYHAAVAEHERLQERRNEQLSEISHHVTCLEKIQGQSEVLDFGQQLTLEQGGLVVRQGGIFSRYTLKANEAGQNVVLVNRNLDS